MILTNDKGLKEAFEREGVAGGQESGGRELSQQQRAP